MADALTEAGISTSVAHRAAVPTGTRRHGSVSTLTFSEVAARLDDDEKDLHAVDTPGGPQRRRLDRVGGSGPKLRGMTDHEYRRPWPITIEEAAEALRQAAEQLAHEPDGVRLLPACQFQQPPWSPCQIAIEHRILLQGHRLARRE